MHHFLDLVAERVDLALGASRLVPGQRDLLCAAIERRRVTRRGNDLGNPVSLFWLVARGLKRPVDETALALAAFCEFYMFSLWLFDDIQDDDLSKTVFAKAGPAIAVNSALIFFCLALNELRLAIEGEPDLERRRGYLRLFTSLALSAGNGQYLDLVSSHGRPTPSEVFAIASTKASAARLLFDLASMFGSDDSRIASLYRSIGEDVTIIGQLVDDMSDLFSGRKSSDLASGRVTYPLACFAEVAGATGDAELSRLRNSMPSSVSLRQACVKPPCPAG